MSREAGAYRAANIEYARCEVELSSLTSGMVEVVEKIVQPVTVSMWLKKGR